MGCGLWSVAVCGGERERERERESERGEMEQIQMRLAAKEEVSID